jgi:hypothetical protein
VSDRRPDDVTGLHHTVTLKRPRRSTFGACLTLDNVTHKVTDARQLQTARMKTMATVIKSMVAPPTPVVLLFLPLLVCGGAAGPFYVDPLFSGAHDPELVFNREEVCDWAFALPCQVVLSVHHSIDLHPGTHMLADPFTHHSTHSLTHSLIHLRIYSPTHAPTHPLTHTATRAAIHVTGPPTHSLTHSLTHQELLIRIQLLGTTVPLPHSHNSGRVQALAVHSLPQRHSSR